MGISATQTFTTLHEYHKGDGKRRSAILSNSGYHSFQLRIVIMGSFIRILSTRRSDKDLRIDGPKPTTNRSVSGATAVSSRISNAGTLDVDGESDGATLLDDSNHRDRDNLGDGHHPSRWWRNWSPNFKLFPSPVLALPKLNSNKNSAKHHVRNTGIPQRSLHIPRRRRQSTAGTNLDATREGRARLADHKLDLGIRRRIFGFDGEHW